MDTDWFECFVDQLSARERPIVLRRRLAALAVVLVAIATNKQQLSNLLPTYDTRTWGDDIA